MKWLVSLMFILLGWIICKVAAWKRQPGDGEFNTTVGRTIVCIGLILLGWIISPLITLIALVVSAYTGVFLFVRERIGK